MFMAMGLYAARYFARISLVPTPILWPIVFALSVIGAYALSTSLLDVWIVLIFGVIGFLARRHGFSVAPIAVGLILDPHLAEEILQKGDADIIAIGREALANPSWPQMAELALGRPAIEAMDDWPLQYGWWMKHRERALDAIRAGE